MQRTRTAFEDDAALGDFVLDASEKEIEAMVLRHHRNLAAPAGVQPSR